MTTHIASMALIVRDYDEASSWYREKLGFVVLQDTQLGPNKRWVKIAPHAQSSFALLLARADKPEQSARIGDQTGGRVFLFLETSDFPATYQTMCERGVRFLEAPRHEAYGSVAVFEDLYGNRWDLLSQAN
jgi:catechol 2,3-dioxygenase-like lactoylglutathione lyase family enzyme